MLKNIIGRSERVNFPLFGLKKVKGKVDTGAFTSSIHCSKIEIIDSEKVRCVFLDNSHKAYTGELLEFELEKEVVVKSSNGHKEKRAMIRTTIEMRGQTFDIFLTLTNRQDMKYPLLLGRRFLKNKFLVDVSKKS